MSLLKKIKKYGDVTIISFSPEEVSYYKLKEGRFIKIIIEGEDDDQYESVYVKSSHNL